MISDEELDKIIDNARPELRSCLRAILAGSGMYAFNITSGTNPNTGVKNNFVCFVAHEYTAMVLQGTAEALGKSSSKAIADMAEAQANRIIH